tara:strand:+ start:251 stop:448 length:198 start_codon:yes stop_codon:yes gene_type:complete
MKDIWSIFAIIAVIKLSVLWFDNHGRKIIKEIHMKNTDYLTKSSNYHFEKFKNEYRHEFRKKNDN